MKLLSINLARSVWLGQLIDFNPKGKNLYPILLPLLVNSYKFKKFPLPNEKLDEVKGIKFEQGEFKKGDDETILILAFTVFHDGFIIDSRSSTKDSDEFIEEILTRAHDEFNLTHYEEVIKRKNYLSQMFVSMDKSLESLNPKVKEISKYVSDNIVGFENALFGMAGISFFPDQKAAPNINPAPFTLERQAGSPFSHKRYFSSAPLQTEKHWELLNKFEEIIGI
jgi:hypothetical protein